MADRQMSLAEVFLDPRMGMSRRLSQLCSVIDWAPLAALAGRVHPGRTGRPPFEGLAMLRALYLQGLYDLSDPGLEEALTDRVSFRLFCGFGLDQRTPDETTLCRFRNAAARAGVLAAAFEEVNRQLDARGLFVRKGTLVDATIIAAASKRPPKAKHANGDASGAEGRDETSEDETGSGKAGSGEAGSGKTASGKTASGKAGSGETSDAAETGSTSGAQTRLAREPGASFTRKGGKSHFGYRLHVGLDQGSGLLRRLALTPAHVSETRVADSLICGDEAAVYADKAYEDKHRRARLKARGCKDRIQHRRHKHQAALPRRQKVRNRLIARHRAPVEAVFGTLKRLHGRARMRFRRFAANLADMQRFATLYNLRRAVALSRAPPGAAA